MTSPTSPGHVPTSCGGFCCLRAASKSGRQARGLRTALEGQRPLYLALGTAPQLVVGVAHGPRQRRLLQADAREASQWIRSQPRPLQCSLG